MWRKQYSSPFQTVLSFSCSGLIFSLILTIPPRVRYRGPSRNKALHSSGTTIKPRVKIEETTTVTFTEKISRKLNAGSADTSAQMQIYGPALEWMHLIFHRRQLQSWMPTRPPDKVYLLSRQCSAVWFTVQLLDFDLRQITPNSRPHRHIFNAIPPLLTSPFRRFPRHRIGKLCISLFSWGYCHCKVAKSVRYNYIGELSRGWVYLVAGFVRLFTALFRHFPTTFSAFLYYRGSGVQI